MGKPYDPRQSIRRATRAMNHVVRTHAPAAERPLTLETSRLPIPCAVLLQSFTHGGPIPDDFTALPRTAAALKAHVRPDGAVYIGAFQSQGFPDSVVVVYGPSKMTEQRAEEIASMERHALRKRHDTSQLGPFGQRRPSSSASAPSQAS